MAQELREIFVISQSHGGVVTLLFNGMDCFLPVLSSSAFGGDPAKLFRCGTLDAACDPHLIISIAEAAARPFPLLTSGQLKIRLKENHGPQRLANLDQKPSTRLVARRERHGWP